MEISRYRTLFISDVHLGTSDCQARYLLDLLEKTSAEQIYLVGDILDFLQMRRLVLPPDHEAVISKLLAMAEAGVRVTYIPGNHDAVLKRFCGHRIGRIEVRSSCVHYTRDGRRLIVSHGDEFDAAMSAGVFWWWVGNFSHTFLMRLNTFINGMRQRLGLPFWSLARFLKMRVGKAMRFIERFETLVAHRARELKVDGYVCGHIHHPDMKWVEDVLYVNDGDWVEHCTFAAEDNDGKMALIHWADVKEVVLKEPLSAALPETLPEMAPVTAG